MKRFWREVLVTAEGGITLDGKPVRTPGRELLVVPTTALAEAIADEWRAVSDMLDPRAMPLTGLANAAIDVIGPNPATFARSLAAYGESDLLCYRAESPAELVTRQAAVWDPLLDWAARRYDIGFPVVHGVVHRPQPVATTARLAAAIAARSCFELAALSPIVTVSGSLVIALALAEAAADTETLWRAATIDEDWQAEHWGKDDLATATRAARRADFEAGARLIALLR